MRLLPCALRKVLLSGALVVSACTEPASLPSAGEILVASGGFFGSSSTQIFSDGTVITTSAEPGKAPIRSITHATPDVYRRAAAVLAAEGAATLHAIKPQKLQCLDYGIDQVSASPPIAGFDKAVSACPDAALSALMSHVLATLAKP